MNEEKYILVIDDDKIDSMTIKRAFKDNDIPHKLIFKQNGEEAIDFLEENINDKPFLIILDLNMPKMNGLEFLKIIREKKELKIIPVVVLTTSRSEKDKLESYKLGISSYIIKSVDYHDFVKVIGKFKAYMEINEFPE